MPLVAALSLISGRRGNAPFCLAGGQYLSGLALFLAICGPAWLAADYLAATLHFGRPWRQVLAPLAEPPGLPWSTACAVWLLGMCCLGAAYLAARHCRARIAAPAYKLAQIRVPLLFCLLASLVFFAAFMLQLWPFAGLPEGLASDAAFMAIFRHASRNFFLGFCPAGAVGLVVLWHFAANIPRHYMLIAARWLAFWAVAGCVPNIIITWGSLIGLGFSHDAALAQGFRPQAIALIPFTCALLCWAAILWRPALWRVLGIAGFCLLLLKTGMPFIMA